jgi:glutathione synthase/RimK-type ligase-like ATP-grasp enzyme
MILVAGGELDFNIGRLLGRMLQRRVPFVDLLIGRKLTPSITVDLAKDELRLNGRAIRPHAIFMRHDVFLQLNNVSPHAGAAALNWYHTIKGWELAHREVRGFNKESRGEYAKLHNLYLAKRVGLRVPDTLVTNEYDKAARAMRGTLIEKPVAGGEHTTRLADLKRRLKKEKEDVLARYPRFVQRKLGRPEMRVYRIGDEFIAFNLTSPDLDYREHNRVKLTVAKAPRAIQTGLRRLTDLLNLDFAAADFMLDRERAYRFLEVNTQPMFAAFDKVADGRVCDAIIDHLMRR